MDGIKSFFNRRRRNERGQDCGNRADFSGRPGVGVRQFQLHQGDHEAKLGPIELSVKDKQTVNVPVWAGVGAIVVAGAPSFGSKKG